MSKCKCIVFGESKHKHFDNKQKRTFLLGENTIEEVEYYNHVGIELSYDMKTHHRTEAMCNRGVKIFGGLTSVGVKNNDLLPKVSLSLWNKIGLSSMLHGCEL